jgi:hypothetical protein
MLYWKKLSEADWKKRIQEVVLGENQWYKIVMRQHEEVEHLTTFIPDLKASLLCLKPN